MSLTVGFQFSDTVSTLIWTLSSLLMSRSAYSAKEKYSCSLYTAFLIDSGSTKQLKKNHDEPWKEPGQHGVPSPTSGELHSQASSPHRAGSKKPIRNWPGIKGAAPGCFLCYLDQSVKPARALSLGTLPDLSATDRFTGLAHSIVRWMKMVPAFPHTDQKLLCRKSTYWDSFVWLLRGDFVVIHWMKWTGTKPAATKSQVPCLPTAQKHWRRQQWTAPHFQHRAPSTPKDHTWEVTGTGGQPQRSSHPLQAVPVWDWERTGMSPGKCLPGSTGAAPRGRCSRVDTLGNQGNAVLCWKTSHSHANGNR